ncbi:MAG: hypothetical protein Ct9H90mP20_7600 [Candidatus Neomarinimicrobiota bacterium]|nr:MAG: hypothetical protein Ct9H90mP20_7600 [Candidatus Neomarinimicrobiota bacterium]
MASVIGKIRSDGQYIVHYNDEIIVDAKANQVTKVFYIIEGLAQLIQISMLPN